MSMRWWKVYGFTVQEIATHMGISEGRVRQLEKKKSDRIRYAVRDLEIAEKLVRRANASRAKAVATHEP